jgi:hypothetical protein
LFGFTFDWTVSDICRSLYVAVADKAKPFLGAPETGPGSDSTFGGADGYRDLPVTALEGPVSGLLR